MKLPLADVARRLDLPVQTVERWIRQGRIPVYHAGDACAFHRATLERWAKAHNLKFADADRQDRAPEPVELERLLPVMRRGGVVHGISGTDPESILKEIVERLPMDAAGDREDLLEGLLERERLTSTGIGNGIAIPHSRTPLTDLLERPLIMTCFPDQPVDFRAIDDRPVVVLFTLLCPSVKTHLHLLSRLSYCARDGDFVDFLRSAPDAERFFERVAEMENRLDRTGV